MGTIKKNGECYIKEKNGRKEGELLDVNGD